jgi:hypothetical protein
MLGARTSSSACLISSSNRNRSQYYSRFALIAGETPALLALARLYTSTRISLVQIFFAQDFHVMPHVPAHDVSEGAY